MIFRIQLRTDQAFGVPGPRADGSDDPQVLILSLPDRGEP